MYHASQLGLRHVLHKVALYHDKYRTSRSTFVFRENKLSTKLSEIDSTIARNMFVSNTTADHHSKDSLVN